MHIITLKQNLSAEERLQEAQYKAPPLVLPPAYEPVNEMQPDVIPERFKEGNAHVSAQVVSAFVYLFIALIASGKAYTTRRAQDPMYTTSAADIGAKNPSMADVPLKWYGLQSQFTKVNTLN